MHVMYLVQLWLSSLSLLLSLPQIHTLMFVGKVYLGERYKEVVL